MQKRIVDYFVFKTSGIAFLKRFEADLNRK